MSDPDRVAQRLWAFQPRLRLLFVHLAGKQLRERVEIDDLVQETFLRALGASERLPPECEGDAELWRFLTHLARHVAVDAARAAHAQKRSGREERLARSEWSRAGPHESQIRARVPGPATAVASAESVERMAAAFLRLAPEHRRVIGVRQFEGLSAAECATRLARSEVAVHSLYRRALEAWEQELARDSGTSRGDSGRGPRSGPA